MPRLNARALSELMALPGYEQYRVLYEQKYPKSKPNVFKTPYYAPALSGIRAYYASGNKPSEIQSARIALASIGNATRRAHNARVLESFVASPQAGRQLSPQANRRLAVSLGNTEIRVSLDLVATEGSDTRRIFYNVRAVPLSKDLARTTLEVAHWLLETRGVPVQAGRVEYIDFAKAGVRYAFTTRRDSTIKRAKQTLKLIEVLWPTI